MTNNCITDVMADSMEKGFKVAIVVPIKNTTSGRGIIRKKGYKVVSIIKTIINGFFNKI